MSKIKLPAWLPLIVFLLMSGEAAAHTMGNVSDRDMEYGPLSFGGGPLAVLALGLFLGLKHATDADHVVAVTTFVSRERSLLRSCWIGAFWGVGHTLSLGVAGLFVIGFKVNIPEWLSTRLELGVAGMLVVLGLRLLVRTVRTRLEVHNHPHIHNDGQSTPGHEHWHAHWLGEHSHSGWQHFGLKPFLVGLVHGAAGSAALMLLVLSTIRTPLQAFLYIVIFGFGSVLGMLAISSLLALPLRWASKNAGAIVQPIQVLAGLFSCVFGLYLGIELWKSLP